MAALSALPSLRARALLSLLPGKLKEIGELEAHRMYLATCAQMAAENTAKLGGGRYMAMSYSELIHPKPVDNRTGEEIIEHMKAVLGGIEKGGEQG